MPPVFFLYYELDNTNFFINKARDLCYFGLNQYLQLNGFNEFSNDFIYDFEKRLIQLKYNKSYIKKCFDLSSKEYLSLVKNIKSEISKYDFVAIGTDFIFLKKMCDLLFKKIK